ncbi:MAG: hypothetical protein V4733_05885 [Verrucomicrobiota bacterium]
MKTTEPPLVIARPCAMDWAAMSGDERKRFCAGCGKHVFNLSAMTAAEATAFAEETQGRECIAYVPAENGRIHTPNRFERMLMRFAGRIPRMAALFSLLLPAAMATGVQRTLGTPLPPPGKDQPVKLGEPAAPPKPPEKEKPVKPGMPPPKPVPIPGKAALPPPGTK